MQWAVREGITTGDQVAIAGGSYGGYATVVGLSFTPDVFRCGVDKAFNAVAEGFLGQCLGGRAEPIGDDLAGSSITVPTACPGWPKRCGHTPRK